MAKLVSIKDNDAEKRLEALSHGADSDGRIPSMPVVIFNFGMIHWEEDGEEFDQGRVFKCKKISSRRYLVAFEVGDRNFFEGEITFTDDGVCGEMTLS